MEKKYSYKTIFVGAMILAVVIAAVFGFRYAKEAQRSTHQSETGFSAKVKGPDSAPVRIVSFSDFQCPACAHGVGIIEGLLEKYPGKIQYVYKHFPLRMHVWSPVAHQAAECAVAQGKFWDFYKKLFKEQATWSAAADPMVLFAEYAQTLGLDMNEFSGCMTDSDVAARIMADKKEGELLEVRSTPTFFVNGKMFAGPGELQMAGEDYIRQVLGLSAGERADSASEAATK